MTITVAAITGVNLDGHRGAIARTRLCLPFETKSHIHYAPGMTRDDYSRIIVKNLVEMIDSDFVMIVQADGFARNPQNWSDEFLNYDFVGAPFPNGEVGNGGFSLRSRRFLEVSATLPEPEMPEDAYLCQYRRAEMEAEGIRFAPTNVAHRFSHEHKVNGEPWDAEDSFGFHGTWNVRKPFYT